MSPGNLRFFRLFSIFYLRSAICDFLFLARGLARTSIVSVASGALFSTGTPFRLKPLTQYLRTEILVFPE